jgi:hypothetical protein
MRRAVWRAIRLRRLKVLPESADSEGWQVARGGTGDDRSAQTTVVGSDSDHRALLHNVRHPRAVRGRPAVRCAARHGTAIRSQRGPCPRRRRAALARSRTHHPHEYRHRFPVRGHNSESGRAESPECAARTARSHLGPGIDRRSRQHHRQSAAAGREIFRKRRSESARERRRRDRLGVR